MNFSLLLIADRGCLKVYAVERPEQRAARLRLLETFPIAEAHGRYADKVTDQAGGFPDRGTRGQGNGTAERMTLDAEFEMRAFREIAGHISDVLRRHSATRWAFAAPAEINGALLDGLPQEFHARLERNVARDLVKTDPADVLAHFALA